MTQVRAAFTLSTPISAEHLQQTSHEVAQWANLTLDSLHAGVVDGWAILSAQFPRSSTVQAHAWLHQTLHELEHQHASSHLFRVEIEEGENSAPEA